MSQVHCTCNTLLPSRPSRVRLKGVPVATRAFSREAKVYRLEETKPQGAARLTCV